MPSILMSTEMYKLMIILLSTILPAIAIVVVVLIIASKKRYRHNSSNLRKTYDDYHAQLTTDCKGMVLRLKELGKYSDYYNSLYLEREKHYNDILNIRDRDMAVSLDSLDTLIKQKNYKSVKDIEKQCSISITDFTKSVSTFNDDLSSLLREDSDTREASLSEKEKFRKIKEFYSKNENELKPLERSFNIIFDNTEAKFAEFNNLADQTKFKEAEAILPQLDKILDALLKIMDSLPLLETLVSTVVPDKLTKLQAEYDQMLKEEYTLDYLNVPKQIRDMNGEIKALKKQLVLLDTTGVKEKLDGIQENITDVLVKFESERSAKQKFLANQNTLSGSSFEVEKQYSRLMNQLTDYDKTYVLDYKYVDQMKALKNDIETLGYLKRELDSYLDTSAKQPYTVITKKMSDMQMEMDKVNSTMRDYVLYLSSLKDTSQKVYQGLRDYFYKLKGAEYIVKVTINVDSYTASVHDHFVDLYQRISKIDSIILKEPVDVNKATSLFNPFTAEADLLISQITKKEEEAKNAEAAIVYANAYRMEYVDSRGLLDTAEKSFNEGDFQRASANALKVVKTFSSDSVQG
ncbi:MAG: septation ring formation regulator EzrA [Bacilli bacterium]